jgi:hypothetical protein
VEITQSSPEPSRHLFHFVSPSCSHISYFYTFIYIHTSYIMTSQHTGKFTWGVGPQKVSLIPTCIVKSSQAKCSTCFPQKAQITDAMIFFNPIPKSVPTILSTSNLIQKPRSASLETSTTGQEMLHRSTSLTTEVSLPMYLYHGVRSRLSNTSLTAVRHLVEA